MLAVRQPSRGDFRVVFVNVGNGEKGVLSESHRYISSVAQVLKSMLPRGRFKVASHAQSVVSEELMSRNSPVRSLRLWI